MNVAIATAPEPHILVVDDDAGLRQHISAYLSEHSLQVSVAQNAAEMEQVLSTKPIEVVVLDVMMPGEDGLSGPTTTWPSRAIPASCWPASAPCFAAAKRAAGGRRPSLVIVSRAFSSTCRAAS
jgi:hypothetical protein